MKKLDRQRKLTLAALSMALVVAVYLDWQYSRVERPTTSPLGSTTGNHSLLFAVIGMLSAVGAGTVGAVSYGYIRSIIDGDLSTSSR